jgi:hypothetical protein
MWMTWKLSQLGILVLPSTCWIYEVELRNFYSHLKEEKCVGGVFGLETPIGAWWCYRLEQQLEEGGECIYWVLFHDC